MSEYTQQQIDRVEAAATAFAITHPKALIGMTRDDIAQEAHLVSIASEWGVNREVAGFQKFAVFQAYSRLLLKGDRAYEKEDLVTAPNSRPEGLGLDFWDWVENHLDTEECEYLIGRHLLGHERAKSRRLDAQIKAKFANFEVTDNVN